MGTQKLSLKWKNHHSNYVAAFTQMLDRESLTDVTLACEGLLLKAHKLILSSCSNFFRDLFFANPCQHPIVILKDTSYIDLKTIVDFMYHGKVDVPQDRWSSFLNTANSLKVKGLTEVASELSERMNTNETQTNARKRGCSWRQTPGVTETQKQRKVQSVVPVSLQHAKQSNWPMIEQTEATTVNKITKRERSDSNTWANNIRSSDIMEHPGSNSFSSSASLSENSWSNSSHDMTKEGQSENASFFTNQSNNISFFTAPISALHSALEENSNASEACGDSVDPSGDTSEITNYAHKEPTIIRFDRVPEFNAPANEEDYILPTPTKQISEHIALKKTSASNMLSALALQASTSSLYAEVQKKVMRATVEARNVERQHSCPMFQLQVVPSVQKMPVLKPSAPISEVRKDGNVHLTKKKGRPRKPSTVRERLHEIATQKKRAASKILSKARPRLEVERAQPEAELKPKPKCENEIREKKCEDRDENEHVEVYSESTKQPFPVLDMENSSETGDKEKKRERRPPKKLDSYIVGSAIPMFDLVDETAKSVPKVLSSPKQKPLSKRQPSPKIPVQKKELEFEPIFTERGEEIHIGQNIWIEQSDWAKAERSETDRQFCNTLASCMWGNTTLMECGITGKALMGNPKRPLSPFKLNVIKDRLTERLIEKNIVAEDISHRVKQVHKYLSDHILSLSRRRDRAFMKQRQQQSL